MTRQTAARTRVLRLRPVVHATAIPDGIHVRGARSSFTMDGAAGLWRLWQAVAAALAEGRSYEQLLDAVPGPAARAAADLLARQLRAHDMLVEVPLGWGESDDPGDPPARIAGWLASVAPDPVDAWERLRSAAVGVCGTGPVAAAGARALAGAGVRVLRPDGRDRPVPHVPPTLPVPPVLFSAGQVTVAAAAGGGSGFVTPAGADGSARRDAGMIAERIGLPAGPPAAGALAALVGGAAAHRLVCAVAGLPDPGEDPLSASPAPPYALGRPTALVARLDPLGAGYHPWWDTAEPGPPNGGPAGLDAVLARVAALGDPGTGALPALAVDDLPQLQAGLVRCRAGDTVVCGVGADTATARLSCATGAAEHLLLRDGVVGATVGAHLRHAEGVRLRRLIHASAPFPEAAAVREWELSPGARRWFKAVTLRFGTPADLRVHRLAPGVFHAGLRGASGLSAWSVEGDAADAAAFCALAAAGTLQWRAAGGDPAALVSVPCGAAPAPVSVPVSLPAAGASDPGPSAADAGAQPVDAAEREDALQDGLRRLLGARAGSARPVAPEFGLRRALAVAGFVALEVAP